MTGGVYAYRTRKPGARFRIPILSYHWAYVGQTSSFWHRHRQHVGYDQGYRDMRGVRWAPGKPWADLEPRCYRLHLPPWKWLRLVVEALAIWALMPVYNVQLNTWNVRRITLAAARAQRARRDVGAHPVNWTMAHTMFVVFLLLLIVPQLIIIWVRLS